VIFALIGFAVPSNNIVRMTSLMEFTDFMVPFLKEQTTTEQI
jgi:hypothetical protein